MSRKVPSASAALAPVLYRTLLRAARTFDRGGADRRVLLASPRSAGYDLLSSSWWSDAVQPPLTSLSPEGLAAAVAESAVGELCNGGRLYPGLRPIETTAATAPQATAQSAFRSAIHKAIDEVGATNPSVLLDAGFALLRRLEATAALCARVVDGHDAAGGDGPHASLPPETYVVGREAVSSGSLLASHPLLRRDVVLLLSAEDGSRGFCMGLVLNQPTAARLGASPLLGGRGQTVGPARRPRLTQGIQPAAASPASAPSAAPAASAERARLPLPSVSEMLRGAAKGEDVSGLIPPAPDARPAAADAGGGAPPRAAREEWTTGNRRLTDPLAAQRHTRDRDVDAFATHVIHYGGPDGGANVTMLHPYAAVRGSVPVAHAPPLRYGGDLQHAAALVRRGEADADAFVFFKGRVDWRPGELQGELDFGEWVALNPTAAEAPPAAGDEAAPAPEPITATFAHARAPGGAHDGAEASDDAAARGRARHAAWASAVRAAVASGGSDELRAWLALRPLDGDEAEAVRALQHAAGDAAVVPPWRALEDWSDQRGG